MTHTGWWHPICQTYTSCLMSSLYRLFDGFIICINCNSSNNTGAVSFSMVSETEDLTHFCTHSRPSPDQLSCPGGFLRTPPNVTRQCFSLAQRTYLTLPKNSIICRFQIIGGGGVGFQNTTFLGVRPCDL